MAMSRPVEERAAPWRTRPREMWELARFAYETLIAPWPPFAAFLVVTGVMGGLAPLVLIRATAGLVDALSTGRALPVASEASWLLVLRPYWTWIALFIGMRLVLWLVTMDSYQRYLTAQVNERVRERFDRLYLAKALSLRLECFESPAYYDALQRARRAMGEGEVSQQLYHVQRLVTLTLSCCGVLWALGRVHWAIAFGLLVGSLALLRRHLRWGHELIDVEDRHTALNRRREYWRSLLTQRGPAAEVRLFGLDGYIVAAWRRLTEPALAETAAARRRHTAVGLWITVAMTVTYSAVALVLILVAARGRLSAGALVAYLYLLEEYLVQLVNVSWRVRGLQQFLVELRHVPRFLALPGEERQTGRPAPAIVTDGLRFEGVSFTYPGAERSALSGIDLHLRPGERVAVVGENGAGKSTLARLLLGLHEPNAGRITVASVNLRDIAPAAWRVRVGAVFQEFVRYSFTARENIGFGRLEKLEDREAIREAARLSGAAAVIEALPEGYETLLGKEFAGGRDLSQGQWQKLAIARAYFRDAELLVLDEPASALDALAEREVYRQFLAVSAGKSVLLISHRLGSARLADRILFLHEGRIVEEGTHDALIAAAGRYAALYAMQAEWYREPEQEVPHATE
jgi:ATP-binding cassette, subfamily B, bacterial